MDNKFIDLLKSQIEKGEEFITISESWNSQQIYIYLSRWSVETENYLKYGIENQDYLTEFKACADMDYNGNVDIVNTFHKKLGYLSRLLSCWRRIIFLRKRLFLRIIRAQEMFLLPCGLMRR